MLDSNHAIGSKESIMDIIHVTNRDKVLNTIEKLYIYKETKIDNQLSDKCTVKPRIIFDTVILKNTDRAHIALLWLRVFHAFSSFVRQIPGQNPQRKGTTRTLPSCCVVLCIVCVVLCIVCFVTFPVLFVCICVLNNCHRVATQLQLNIYLIITTGSPYLSQSQVLPTDTYTTQHSALHNKP
jgi:hypothetical protein